MTPPRKLQGKAVGRSGRAADDILLVAMGAISRLRARRVSYFASASFQFCLALSYSSVHSHRDKHFTLGARLARARSACVRASSPCCTVAISGASGDIRFNLRANRALRNVRDAFAWTQKSGTPNPKSHVLGPLDPFGSWSYPVVSCVS